MKKLSSLLIGAIFALVTVAVWALANQPSAEPVWPRSVHGFAFQPFQKDQSAIAGDEPTLAQIDRDLELLEGKTRAVRTYSTLGTVGQTAALASKHHLQVMLGAWLDSDRERNAREVEAAIRLAKQHRNVTRIIIGNEVIAARRPAVRRPDRTPRSRARRDQAARQHGGTVARLDRSP